MDFNTISIISSVIFAAGVLYQRVKSCEQRIHAVEQTLWVIRQEIQEGHD
jgi:hypothetical protein